MKTMSARRWFAGRWAVVAVDGSVTPTRYRSKHDARGVARQWNARHARPVERRVWSAHQPIARLVVRRWNRNRK